MSLDRHDHAAARLNGSCKFLDEAHAFRTHPRRCRRKVNCRLRHDAREVAFARCRPLVRFERGIAADLRDFEKLELGPSVERPVRIVRVVEDGATRASEAGDDARRRHTACNQFFADGLRTLQPERGVEKAVADAVGVSGHEE